MVCMSTMAHTTTSGSTACDRWGSAEHCNRNERGANIIGNTRDSAEHYVGNTRRESTSGNRKGSAEQCVGNVIQADTNPGTTTITAQGARILGD